MKKVNLLFTGGFDSTFRLCQLSRMEDIEVQPIYLSFTYLNGIFGRANREKEIVAQNAIIAALRKKPETKAKILDPIRIQQSELPSDPAYDKAFLAWRPSKKIPSMYCVLGKLALLYPNLEIGREGPTLRNRQRGWKVGKTRKFLTENGVKFTDRADGSVILSFKHAKPGLELLFGRYKYPILGIPETSMVPYIKEWGYEDVFKLTWTCDFGSDEPCGVCHNCETKWDSGLVNFFAPHAVRNHEIKRFLERLKEKDGVSPVELMGKDQLPDAFVRYVGDNYHFDPMDGILEQPMAIQQLNYRFKKLRNANTQKYFDELIRAWDNGEKEKYIASLY